MDIKKLPAYELVMQENIPDVQSVGYLDQTQKKRCQSDGAGE